MSSVATPEPVRFEFAGFRLEVRERQLFKDHVRVPITTKAFDVLLSLVRRRGEIATKDQLMSEVWTGSVVTEDSLTQNISFLRRVLEDDPAQPRFIATVARRGYRFIATVTPGFDDSPGVESSAPASAPLPDAATRQPPAEIPGDHHSTSTEDAVPLRRSFSLLQRTEWVLAAVLLLVGGITLGVLMTPDSTPEAVSERRLRFAPGLPPDTTLASGGVVSPDGRHVAFVARDLVSGETRLWIRNLSTGTVYPLTGSSDAVHPFWAPNGQDLAFFAGGRLLRTRLAGGMPILVCTTVAPRPAGGTWNDRGQIFFSDAGGLYVVPEAGGEPELFLQPDPEIGEISLAWPQSLPGGMTFLYAVISSDATASGIYAGSLDQPIKRRILDVRENQVAYTRGDLIYVREGRLFARGFDPGTARFTGDPIVIDSAAPNAVVSAGGNVIAFGGGVSEELAEFDRQGRALRTITGTPPLRNLTLSPDRRFLIGDSIDPVLSGSWLVDIERETSTRIFESGGAYPLWLQDGRTVAYSAVSEPGSVGLYLRNMQSGTDSLLFSTQGRPFVSGASADGRIISYTLVQGTATRQDIWVVDSTDAESARRVLASEAREIHPSISPDGRWIAYVSDEDGSYGVYLDAFPDLGRKQRVSTSGGTQPQWRADGRELFYLSADQAIMSVSVTMIEPDLRLAPARPLFQPMLVGHMGDFRNQYAVSPDGNSFFIGIPSRFNTQEPITLIVNWRGSTG